jgi:hypothetical protein
MSCPYDPEAVSATDPTAKNTGPINKDMNEPIPQPPVHWFTKNISEMNPSFPIAGIWRLADSTSPFHSFYDSQSIFFLFPIK